jgi:hypothetical protein
MTQWHFVIAAYVVTGVVTLGLCLASVIAMRRADQKLHDIGDVS